MMMKDMKNDITTKIQENKQEIMYMVERRITQGKSTTIDHPRTTHIYHQQQPITTPKEPGSHGLTSHVQVYHSSPNPSLHNESLHENERTQDPITEPEHFRWKHEKAFQQKLNAKAIKYNGLRKVGYRPWKEALEREVRELHLDAFQMLQLLEARTEGDALKVIENNRIMTIESSPEYAIKEAWAALDERFYTEDRPSEQLLKEIQQGPIILRTDAKGLYAFAQKCNNLTNLQKLNPASLSTLNEKATQNKIIARLDEQLNDEWYKYKQTLPTHHTTIPFYLFSGWIKTQAKVQLDRQENKPTTPTLQSKSRTSEFNQTKTSSPIFTKRNTYSREYKDTLRSRGNNNTIYNKGQNNSRISQLDISTTGSEFQQPLYDSTHATLQDSTRTNEKFRKLQCAWCFSTNQPHKHLTSQCSKFPHQDKMEQWRIVYKYRVCSRCLEIGHYYKSCTIDIPPCNTCHISHHKNLACRPLERISTTYTRD